MRLDSVIATGEGSGIVIGIGGVAMLTVCASLRVSAVLLGASLLMTTVAGAETPAPAPSATNAAITKPAPIDALDPAIVHVRMLGSWESADGTGPVRLALIRDAADAAIVGLYIQWLKDGAVLATKEVPEIRMNRFVLLDIRPDPGVGEIAVHLHVRTEGGDEPSPLLIIREPGVVEFKAAEN